MLERYQQFRLTHAEDTAYIVMSNKPGDLVRERTKIVTNHEDSCLTMFNFISSMLILLTLFGSNNGQQRSCNFNQWIEPGVSYVIKNIEYPQKYFGGSNCQWVAVSDRPIRVTCEPFNVPFSPQCEGDKLIIQDGNAPGRRYCGGHGRLTVASKTNQFTLTLVTTPYSEGGSFYCTVYTEQPKDNCECGIKNSPRIVGGESTTVHEYPMMASLMDFQQNSVICGATIINVKQVLTAAHCVVGRNRENTRVWVGDYDLTTGADTAASRSFLVDSFHWHAQYDPDTTDFDIALVTVNGYIGFNDYIGPVCLPFQRPYDTFAGDYVEILGWGSSAFAYGPVNVLKKARLSVLTRQQCTLEYPNHTVRQMCTQEPGKDACQFDSGGPLLWQSPSTRRVIQVGVISLGSICANGDPARNTRVAPLLPWIESNTPPGIKYCKLE